MLHGTTQEAGGLECWVGRAENRQVPPLAEKRAAPAPHPEMRADRVPPFPEDGLFPENTGDGGEHATIGDAGPCFVERAQAKHVDPEAIADEPVERFIHEARVVAAEARGGEHERLRIDHPSIAGARATGDADGGPLAPRGN